MLCALFGLWCSLAATPEYTTHVFDPGTSLCCTTADGRGECWREVGAICHSNPNDRVHPLKKPEQP